MSTFFSTGLNRKIDALMDRLFGAGVASHATIIEQINYLMFLRALTTHDDEAKLLNPDHEEIFKGELAKYRWDNLLMLNAEVLFDTLEEAYRKLPELTTDKTVALLFRNAHIKVYDKPTLRVLLHEIEKLVTELDDVARHGSKDIFGDMYEYLLSKLAQAGTNGQFRTPRHIIKFIVDVVDPEKGETILDPACGTAGFLVAALDHLRNKYSSERFIKDGAFPMDKLTANERDFIFNHAFTGFDSDEDMVKFGVMNLFLHNLSNASIKRQNTLVDTAGDRTKWDVILANPPFAGKIESESVSEDLRMGTRATEVLFVRYMIDHLSLQGKAGIIVPEGVIFQSTNAHKQLRQKLIDAGLWCVVSLPAGVFQPYSGVKTSILFIDKNLAKKFNRIMFISINADGFDLSANRRPVVENDLTNAYRLIEYCKKEINKGNIRDNYYFPFEDADHSISIAPLHYSFEKVERIGIEKDLTLQAGRYKVNEPSSVLSWPVEELENVADISKGTAITKAETISSGTIPVVAGGQKPAYFHNISNRDKGTITVSASGAYAGFVNYWEVPIFASDCSTVKSKNDSKVMTRYIFEILKYQQDEIYKFQKGGGQPHVYPKDIQKIKIPIPPLEVQQEIVGEISNYQKIIDSAKQIKSSWRPHISIDPEWPQVELGELGEFKNGLNFSKSSAGEKIKVVGVGNFKDNIIAPLDDLSEITVDSKITDSYLLQKGDLLFVRSNGNQELVGRSIVVPELTDRISFSGFTIRYRLNPNLNPLFYAWLFKSEIHRKLLKNIGQGTNIRNLSQEILRTVKVPYPAIEVQNEIVEAIENEHKLVESAEELISIYSRRIKNKLAEIWNT